jgi:hypothetical protein
MYTYIRVHFSIGSLLAAVELKFHVMDTSGDGMISMAEFQARIDGLDTDRK